MSTVAQAKAAIYNRLASAPTFHPASADLFTDFTLQSGDVITVNSGTDSYNVPIYGLQMKWNGTTKAKVQSTGNEKRPSLEKMIQSASSGGGGGCGYRQQRKRQERIEFIVGIDENGDPYVNNPGYIVMAINEDSESEITIHADRIDMDGVVTALEAYDISCGDLTASNISCQSVVSEGGVSGTDGYFSNGVWLGEDEFQVLDITVNTAGDTLTITKVDGSTITFNKATSISSSNFLYNQTGSTSGRSNVGSVSVSSLSGNTYIFFTMTAGGISQGFYITVNA